MEQSIGPGKPRFYIPEEAIRGSSEDYMMFMAFGKKWPNLKKHAFFSFFLFISGLHQL